MQLNVNIQVGMTFPKPKSLKTGRVGILPTSIFLSRENFGATGLRGGGREAVLVFCSQDERELE